MEIETSDTRSLLDRAQAGDTDAFCEICRLYETRLWRQAIALCGDATLAEDLAQDTLVEAWKCLRRYNGRCQFFTWLCAILLKHDLDPTISNYQMVAKRSLEELDELLTRQGNRNPPPTPLYTASTFPRANLSD